MVILRFFVRYLERKVVLYDNAYHFVSVLSEEIFSEMSPAKRYNEERENSRAIVY